MNDSIRIGANVKRVMINDDPNRVITFDPTDVKFAENFYGLLGEVDSKLTDFQKKANVLNRNTALDENGMPINFKEQVSLYRELCEYLKEKIDLLFGPGTSRTAFGDSLNLEMIGEFLQGVTPFIEQARNEKLAAYLPGKKKGTKRVMR